MAAEPSQTGPQSDMGLQVAPAGVGVAEGLARVKLLLRGLGEQAWAH